MPQHHTQTIDGYRWRLYAWEDSFKAQAQKRITDEKGRPVFCNVGVPAYFDSERNRFVLIASFAAQAWASYAPAGSK